MPRCPNWEEVPQYLVYQASFAEVTEEDRSDQITDKHDIGKVNTHFSHLCQCADLASIKGLGNETNWMS